MHAECLEHVQVGAGIGSPEDRPRITPQLQAIPPEVVVVLYIQLDSGQELILGHDIEKSVEGIDSPFGGNVADPPPYQRGQVW